MLSVMFNRSFCLVRDNGAVWQGQKEKRVYKGLTLSSYHRLISLVCDNQYSRKITRNTVKKYIGLRIVK